MTTPATGARLAGRVILIGWDAADWKIINPLLDSGQMPHLARFLSTGVMGNLASLRPMLSPMLWTSIATGKRPHKHGIHGFVEPDESGQNLRAVTSTSRTAKALWNILTQCGMTAHVVGWYAGHPPEPIRGTAVSEHFFKAVGQTPEQWPVPPEMVHPPESAAELAALRVHPSEIDGHSLLDFVPRAAEVDQSADERLGLLARNLAECVSIHSCTTWLLDNQPADLVAAYYPTLDHLCHLFMHCHPPRMAGVPDADFALYSGAVNAAYRFHDLLLGAILNRTRPGDAVILCSDHGYHNDHQRPPFTPGLPAGAAIWHRPYGIVAMRGPGIRADERVYGAGILDIAPTVLYLLGLPVGADMDGRVLASAFESPSSARTIPSWEQVPGEAGMHPPGAAADTWANAEAVRQLVELGYLDAPSGDRHADIAKAIGESRLNLAISYLEAHMPAAALPLLEEIYESAPDHLLVGLHLATCYQRLRRPVDARRTAEAVLARCPKDSDPGFGRPRARRRMSEADLPRLAPRAEMLLGMLDLDEGNAAGALERFLRAEQAGASHDTSLLAGRAYLRMRRWTGAESSLRRALEWNPDSEVAHDALAEALLGLRRNEEAAAHALEAVGRRHHLPSGHFHLGVALARLGMTQRALTAFDHCIAMRGERAPHAVRWAARLRRLESRRGTPA